MKILWFTWKDLSHPIAGGAEVVNEEIAKRLVKDGHQVQFVVGSFEGAQEKESRDGYEILRTGNKFTVYYKAYQLYKRGKLIQADLVIDEVNTLPFFARFFLKEKSVLFVHQLAREIWFYQMVFPLNLIGYLLEPLYMWLLRKSEVITVSESTKKGLLNYGYNPERIHIISEGIQLEPVEDVSNVQKYENPTVLALGSVRPMKRTLHVVKAFEIAKEDVPNLRLIVAGSLESAYGKRLQSYVYQSAHRDSITLLGKVDDITRKDLMRRSHVLAVASVREGWGLTVTEAASQGTPAVVYDVPGLRDSVKNGETGLISATNSPLDLAESITSLLSDAERYTRFTVNGWNMSKEITFERCYADFLKVLAQ